MQLPLTPSTDHIYKYLATFLLGAALIGILQTARFYNEQFATFDFYKGRSEISNAESKNEMLVKCISSLEIERLTGCNSNYFIGNSSFKEKLLQIRVLEKKEIEDIIELKKRFNKLPEPVIHGVKADNGFKLAISLSGLLLFLSYISFALWRDKVQKPSDELVEINLKIRKIELEILRRNLSDLKKTRKR